MKIRDIQVDGFGVWSGLKLSELSDKVNVFYGPNEAGKTTLMQFVRAMLYGFSPQRRERYLPPVRPGRPGGVLTAQLDDRQYSISRHADEPGELGDAPLVNDGHGTSRDAAALAPLLGEVDEATFSNVFAFGLHEIQELGTLSDTRAADELYDLALGLDRVSLLDVMHELETSRTRLLAPDERPSLVSQLIGQRERLQSEIDELAQGTARYLALAAERDKLNAEMVRLEEEVARFERQGRELALARALADRWHRRGTIDERLGQLTGLEGLPENALARFDQLEARLANRKRRFERLRASRRELAAQIDALGINEALCRHAPRLEALAEQQQWIASLETEVSQLEVELLELESQHEDGLKQFGISAAMATGQGISRRGWSELRDLAKRLHAARAELADAKEKITAAQDTAAAQHRQIAAAIDGEHPDGLTHTLAEAGELVSQLRKRVQLDQRLDQLSRRESELEEQGHEHLEKQILPTWAIVGVGGLFVLGCALVLLFLAGLVLPVSFSNVLGWPLGLVGVAAAGIAAFWKVMLEHSASRQLDSCHAQLKLLTQQIEQAKQERDDLDRKLPRGGGPLVARLQTAEKTLARLEELLPLESQREDAEREASMLAVQVESKAAEYHRLRKNWRQQLAEHGLPVDLKPSQVKAYARRRHELGELSSNLEQGKAELARRRREYDMLTGRINQLAVDAGLTPKAQRPLEQLRECLAELSQQQSREKQRDQLRADVGRVVRRQKKIKRQARTLRAQWGGLLQAAGTSDALAFRRLAQAQAEALRLVAERNQLAHEIEQSLAGYLSEEQLAEWLASPQDLEQLEAHVADARRIAAGHANQARERRGEMNQQLATMVDDRRLAHKRLELGVVDRRLRDALERWRLVTTCGMMLEAVRAFYEREHQPPALREASGYLKRLTQKRYTRVWTPLGEHRLVVDDAEGNSLNVELLSRGTREQLFLALRLALVSAYARRGVQLPLVLDDVLVNFDIGRAKAAALVLRDFARAGHQLLIFSCHEHIARLFQHLKAEVRRLPDNGQPGSEAPRMRRARRAEPQAPVEDEPLPETEEEEAEEEVVEEAIVEQPVAEVEPAIAPPEPEPLPPTSLPQPTPPRIPRPVRRIKRVEWSAEEFEGELADRVRAPRSMRREHSVAAETLEADDEDAEAA
jgi:uncharacterized protein YhaN